MRLAPSLLALIAVVTGPADSVLAAPMTFTFAGVVTENGLGGATGQTIIGSISVDPATYYLATTDGSTYNFRYANYYPPSGATTPYQTSPLQVHGVATDGISGIAIGGGTSYDYSEIGVVRNNGGVFNSFDVFGKSVQADGSYTLLGISIQDHLGAASGIFSAPAGVLSLTQDVNWFAAGATTLINVAEFDRSGTSIVNLRGYITSVAVPEPHALTLSVLALMAALATTRRQA